MADSDLKVYREACWSTKLGICILDIVYSQVPFLCIHVQLSQNVDQFQIYCCWVVVQMGLQSVLGFCSIAQAMMQPG